MSARAPPTPAKPPSRLRHHHFVLFVAVFVVATPVLLPVLGATRALLAGFDAAAALFCVSVMVAMHDTTAATMRGRAEREDAGRTLLIAVTAISLAIVLVAVTLETRRSPGLPGNVPLSLATLALAWVFGNLVFTLQYAHRFYLRIDGGDRGGLDFPGCPEPAYADFAYFAFVVGMTFQVSDVTISDAGARRLCLAHALIAFFFNIGVLALSVNVLAGSG